MAARLQFITLPLVLLLLVLSYTQAISTRATSNRVLNGNGSIIFEEAWIPMQLVAQVAGVSAPPVGQTSAELTANLLDIHNQRLAHMDATNVDYMIISCASPCIQGLSNPANATLTAQQINNVLHDTIANNTERFGAFAALSMHDPEDAAKELKRAVNELGFVGALVNDYQVGVGEDGNVTFIYYDQPSFDPFWQTVTELNVPIYFHPRTNPNPVSTLLYAHAPWLHGPSQEFTVTLSTHILGLCTNGVFDRFPSLKIIVGHLGERIPSDLVRIDNQLTRQVPAGMPMLRTVSSYFKSNIFTTTSGNFATQLLQFHGETIGLDRILYSVDYPYVSMEEGENWLESELPKGRGGFLSDEEVRALKRGRAIDVLGLAR